MMMSRAIKKAKVVKTVEKKTRKVRVKVLKKPKLTSRISRLYGDLLLRSKKAKTPFFWKLKS